MPDTENGFGIDCKTFLLCLICTFCWGLGYPVLKMSYDYWSIGDNDIFTKLEVAGIRFLLAGFSLFIISSFRKRRIAIVNRQMFPWTAALGICQTVLQYGLLYIGLSFTSGTKGSVLNQFSVFLLVVLTPLFFKNEKYTFRKIISCIVGFSGIIIMNIEGLSLMIEPGDILVLMSSCFAAAGYLISKGMPKGADPMACTAYQQMFGGVILFILGICGGGHLTEVNTYGLLCLLFLIIEAALCFSIWFYLLRHYDANKIGSIKFLTPVFGVIFSGILLKEPVMKAENILALVLVSLGIIIANTPSRVKAVKGN